MGNMLQPLAPDSDRLVLTVRVSSDGNREWLDASGTIALVFCEHGFWWSRISNRYPRQKHDSEKEALDALLVAQLNELRESFAKVVEQRHINYLMEG